MVRQVPRTRRWFPVHQPSTLQIAAVLLYWSAFLGLISGLFVGGAGRYALILTAAEAAGAYGIANERRWGYGVALVAAVIPLVLVLRVPALLGASVLGVLFQIALVALLLHPQSRDYYRLWYR
ncbi:MAG TPA: hypothetical protein VED84_06330 [Acidimicrobiales bacterium]|nr:hypothetical protein [Acidimicrobiales bacterium]